MGKRGDGQGSLWYDEKRDRWVGSVRSKSVNGVPGKRYKVSAKTQPEAIERLDDLRAKLKKERTVTPANVTVADAVALWRQDHADAARDLAPTTIARYEWAIGLVLAAFGKTKLRSLKVKTVSDGLKDIAAGKYSTKDKPRPLAKSSVARVRAVLSEVMDAAVTHELCDENPVPKVAYGKNARRPRTDNREILVKVLKPEEANALLRVLTEARTGPRPEWYEYLFRTMLATGMRPGEAMGLCWDAVDLEAGTVTVRRSIRSGVLVDEVKTADGYRTLKVGPSALAALKAQRAQVAKAKLAAKGEWRKSDPELVFPGIAGEIPDPANVRRALTRLCRKAGVPTVSPNALRHTTASALVDAGMPLVQVADLLGHTTTRMLEEVYRHRVRQTVDAALVMDDVLTG